MSTAVRKRRLASYICLNMLCAMISTAGATRAADRHLSAAAVGNVFAVAVNLLAISINLYALMVE